MTVLPERTTAVSPGKSRLYVTRFKLILSVTAEPLYNWSLVDPTRDKKGFTKIKSQPYPAGGPARQATHCTAFFQPSLAITNVKPSRQEGLVV